jgi:hypothetical protein
VRVQQKKNPHKEPGKEERAELALLPVNQFSLTRWRGAYSLIIIIPSRSPPLPPLCPPRSLSPPLPSSRQDGQQFHLEKRFFLSLFLRIRAPFPEARSLDLGPFLFVRSFDWSCSPLGFHAALSGSGPADSRPPRTPLLGSARLGAVRISSG